jgi:hypothetical protein
VPSDLDYLVGNGYLAPRVPHLSRRRIKTSAETTIGNATRRRRAQPISDPGNYIAMSVELVVTETGIALIEKILLAVQDLPQIGSAIPAASSRIVVVKPRWSAVDRELWWGDTLLKHFRKSAPVQECLLGAFQDKNWPRQIPNPLTSAGDTPAADRLENVIKKLNRTLLVPVIQFAFDRSRENVLWRLAPRSVRHPT